MQITPLLFLVAIAGIMIHLSRSRMDTSTPSADEPEDELTWEPINR